MRASTIAGLSAILLLPACAPGRPDTVCSTVSGTIAEELSGPTASNGTITGGLTGEMGITIDSVFPGHHGAQRFTGRRWISPAAADTLFTTEQGLLLPGGGAGIYKVRTALAVAGGTGAFRSATGRLVAEGEASFGSGAIALRYSGEICRPERSIRDGRASTTATSKPFGALAQQPISRRTSCVARSFPPP